MIAACPLTPASTSTLEEQPASAVAESNALICEILTLVSAQRTPVMEVVGFLLQLSGEPVEILRSGVLFQSFGTGYGNGTVGFEAHV